MQRADKSKACLQTWATWLVVFPSLLFIWESSFFQYSLYWQLSTPIAMIHVYGRFAAMALWIVLGMGIVLYPGWRVNRLYVAYVVACLFYSLVNLHGFPAPRLLLVQSIVLTTGLIYVLVDRTRLECFLWLNAGLGIVSVALNTVPVLDFYDIVALPYEEAVRLGGGFEASKVPLRDYGLFGRSEMVANLRLVGTNRLQGWSFEPIHWAYFVLWTAVCCFLLLKISGWHKRRVLLCPALVLLGVHLLYVNSMVALLVVGFSTLVTATSWLFRSASVRFRATAMFAAVVVVPGLIVPLVLALVPGSENFFYEAGWLTNPENWESKVAFLRFGSDLLTRLWPVPDLGSGAGHNLVLMMYILFGLPFLVPLLWLEWVYLKETLRSSNRILMAAALLSLVALNHQVPGQLFYPTGGMWLLVVAAAVRFAEPEGVAGQVLRSVADARE